MHLQYDKNPAAGHSFSFTVSGEKPPFALVYYVGNRPYGEEMCEQSPCTLLLDVPVAVSSEFLRLVVSDGEGNSEEFRLRIE